MRAPVALAAWTAAAGLAGCAGLTGCAGPGPELFPLVPLRVCALPDGRTERWYDTDADGREDYCERLSPQGIVVALSYAARSEGGPREDVVLADVPAEQHRHLVLILDSIPFEMVQNLWQHGRLRLFYPPTRVLAPFPVMTDVSLAEFFGVSPCPGVESQYYDGRTLTDGYAVYAHRGNVPWHACTDYRMEPVAHAASYLWPYPWYDHELRRVQETFEKRTERLTTAYIVGTSALGARGGRNGHQAGLIRADRFCQQLVYKSRGRARISLFSDHGHALASSQRLPLRETLSLLGYRVNHRLEKPYDVVVPEFGMVTCAAIYAAKPAQVAMDVVGLEGLDLVAYREPDDTLMVLSPGGRARITQSAGGFKYEALRGDPLELLPVIARLSEQSRVRNDGFVDDPVLFEATISHVYPDAIQRLWRAFHGLVKNTPDVLLATRDGWHCGSPFMSGLVRLTAAHGNLRPTSSTAFCLTMMGQLPPVLRMADLRGALRDSGVPLNPQPPEGTAGRSSVLGPAAPTPEVAAGGVVK